jgi:NAD(P)H-hydrate epimerase
MASETPVFPSVSVEQMKAVDRLMIEAVGVDLLQMMENAGRNLARVATGRFLGQAPAGKVVTVLAGTGGKGGAALAAARHLHNWGASVQLLLARPAVRFQGAPEHQLQILAQLQLPRSVGRPQETWSFPELIIDGLVGYGLSGAPEGPLAGLIEWANSQKKPMLALDIPSGLDGTTGEAQKPTIQATATMTLALPKTGLLSPAAKHYVGELYLADIGVPPEVYAHPSVGLRVGHLFSASEVIRIN